jgi:hypothetical protein
MGTAAASSADSASAVDNNGAREADEVGVGIGRRFSLRKPSL